MRGFRSRHVLLLINGVQVNSTADGQFDPARISTQSIREIKISYGSSSVLYGDNALAAVIEITTVDDRPKTPRGRERRHARSERRWRPLRPIGGQVVAHIDGHRLRHQRLPASGLVHANDGRRRRPASEQRPRSRRRPRRHRLSSLARSVDCLRVVPGYRQLRCTASTISANDIFAQTPRFERVNEYAGVRSGVAGRATGGVQPPRMGLQKAQREDRARYDDATFTSMDDPLMQGTFESRERTTVAGSSALARVNLEKFGRLRVAFNQRRESFDSSGVIRDVPVSGSEEAEAVAVAEVEGDVAVEASRQELTSAHSRSTVTSTSIPRVLSGRCTR